MPDGRYVMQLRDDIPQIWFPGRWGCFGGGVEPGEDSIEALQRELFEELEFRPGKVEYFTELTFDLVPMGLQRYTRIYYVVRMTEDELARVVLHEGKEVRAIDGDTLLRMMSITPYDEFALFLHHARQRIAAV